MKKIKLCIILLLTISYSCQKEEQIDIENNDLNETKPLDSNLSIENITYDEIKDLPIINESFTALEKKKSLLSDKSKGSDIYEFKIDSNNIKKVERDGRISYTILVNRENSFYDGFENLVIDTDQDGEPSIFLLQYPDLSKITWVDEHESFSYSDEPLIIPLLDENTFSITSRQIEICYSVTVTYCTWGGTTHVAGNACLSANDGRTYTTTRQNCISFDDGGGSGGGTGGGSGGGSGGGGGKGDGDVDTSPIVDGEDVTFKIKMFARDFLSSNQRQYFYANYDTYISKIAVYLDQNNFSYDAKSFVKWAIDVDMLKKLPCGVNHNCIESIEVIAEGLRKFHGEEGDIAAGYLESLISDYSSFTNSELFEFYQVAKMITQEYNNKMFNTIVGAYIDGMTPIAEIALYEVGAPVAVKLFQKIPVKWVFRGARLNNVVRKMGVIGRMAGSNNKIREVVTSSPVTRARAHFNALTKHAISKTTSTNGAVTANMGNGRYIIYRPITASTSNTPATITLNFPNIWSKPRQIKFITP